MKVTVDLDYTTLAKLIWRHHHRQDSELLRRSLELNPGIADLGEILPLKLDVELPDIEAPKPKVRNTIQLWSE